LFLVQKGQNFFNNGLHGKARGKKIGNFRGNFSNPITQTKDGWPNPSNKKMTWPGSKILTRTNHWNQVDGYFLCWEKYLTLPSNWKHVQLIDLTAQLTTKSFFCNKTQREKKIHYMTLNLNISASRQDIKNLVGKFWNTTWWLLPMWWLFLPNFSPLAPPVWQKMRWQADMGRHAVFLQSLLKNSYNHISHSSRSIAIAS